MSHVAAGAALPPDEALTRAPAVTPDPSKHPEAPAAPTEGALRVTQRQPPAAPPPVRRYRKWLVWAGVVAGLVAGSYFLVPWVDTALNTVRTDDAYVNGHVTMVAPGVSGQVKKVLVDDNKRVKKGDLLVQLDPEPFPVQVALKRAAVQVAELNPATAESKARGLSAQLGSQRWKLQVISEQVGAQVAHLKVKAANLRAREATRARARGRLRARPGAVRAVRPEP